MLKLASAVFLFGFFKFIKKVSIFYEYRRLYRIDLIKLLYTVLVNNFDLYNEYNIYLTSFFNFIELLPACI